MNPAILDRTRLILTNLTGTDHSETPASHFLTREIGLDSLDLIDLEIAIEHELGIYIFNRDWDTVQTLGQLAKLIERLQDDALPGSQS